jgi:hypothetical protein
LTAFILLSGCYHNLRITNLDDYFSPPSKSFQEPISIGVTSSSAVHPQNSRYIQAVVFGLQRTGSFTRVIFPYDDSIHRNEVQALIDISVNPRYSGRISNFFVNFPGFVIWAPALFGYGYTAEIETVVSINDLKDDRTQQISIPTLYKFRQAEFDRTWTEISWLEVGAIAFIGGLVFTQYDPDVTDDFIRKVSFEYGNYVANKITTAIRVDPL